MNNYEVLTTKDLNKGINDLTYSDYFYRLMLIARSVFKWNNLPNNIDEKWIEKFLFSYGSCLFYYDKEKGYMVAKCNSAGELNPYDEPTLLTPYGTNYIGEPLEVDEECVLIRNNDLMLATSATIQLYALRLAEVTRAIDVNVNAQKTPLIVLCTDKQKLSLDRVVKACADNEIVVYGDKTLDIDSIKALKTDAPIVFDKLSQYKHELWDECMTFLGINNANTDKRERLIVDEVEANNGQIELSAHVMLKARERACEMINKVFKLDKPVSVELRSDILKKVEQVERSIE